MIWDYDGFLPLLRSPEPHLFYVEVYRFFEVFQGFLDCESLADDIDFRAQGYILFFPLADYCCDFHGSSVLVDA